MTTQHLFQVRESQKKKFKKFLAECFQEYNDISTKLELLIKAKKDIDHAWDMSINELKRLYEEERKVDISMTLCGNYEPRF